MTMIGVANLKGGTGKSTVSQALASYFLAEGYRTALVDADPQGTSREWANRAAERGHTVARVMNFGGAKAMQRALLEMASEWDVVIVDCPPRLGEETVATMAVVDLLVMPVAPRAADAWALETTLAELRKVETVNRRLVARGLLNRVDRTALGRAMATELFEAVAMFDAFLRERIAFGECMVHGQAILDYAPKSEAAHEVRRLGREITRTLNERNAA